MRLRLVQELLDENEESHNAGRETNAAKNNVQCSEVNCHDWCEYYQRMMETGRKIKLISIINSILYGSN